MRASTGSFLKQFVYSSVGIGTSFMEVPEYDPEQVETRWQRYWNERELFEVDTAEPVDEDEKYYCLVMFPYPSGALHVGHGRNYIIADALVRYKMMNDKTVLSPMGWDAFGLPAENAAIEENVEPEKWTYRNIEIIREQLERWGIGYDWSREVASCHPGYYRWTQWLFLQLYKEDHAYREHDWVNWCDSCQTVLANEQVLNGECERCGSDVGERPLQQWFFEITAYAQELLDDLELLDDWPDRVKTMQRNWIGRSEGAEIQFDVAETDAELTCFTTRPDTLYGVTFMVLAPEHPLVETLAERSDRTEEILEFAREARQTSLVERTADDVEKKGMSLDAHVINPINGERVPLWVSNYALMEYGTGAVMAVPAHDQRDFEFARKYDFEIRPVIQPEDEELDGDDMTEAYEEEGIMTRSGPFDGVPSREGIDRVTEYLEENDLGQQAVQYKLRDWLISRQRYWGTPIPIIYCDECGTVPVPEEDLPVKLPDVDDVQPTGESPLAAEDSFRHTTCPECGGPAGRETDTMDTFVDSTWYFLRYISPRLESAPWDREQVNRWLPVDQYIGGVEHAVLHLLYTRFIMKFLNDIDRVDFNEPFESLFTQGMIYRRAYRCPECRRYVSVDNLEQRDQDTWIHPECGTVVESEMTKMSKSKNNSISPDDLIDEYGADVERLYTLFLGPPDKDAEWDDQAIVGCDRFIKRVWRLVHEYREVIDEAVLEELNRGELDGDLKDLHIKTHRTIKQVTEDFEDRLHPNTAISSLMELANAIQEIEFPDSPTPNQKSCIKFSIQNLIKLLSPFAPHIAEELWQTIGRMPSILEKAWPRFVEKYTVADEIEIVLQVDGTVRGRMNVPRDIGEDQLKERACEHDRVQEYLDGNDPERMIVVPEKLVNVVTG